MAAAIFSTTTPFPSRRMVVSSLCARGNFTIRAALPASGPPASMTILRILAPVGVSALKQSIKYTRKLTTTANQCLVMLLIDINCLCDSGIKLLSPLQKEFAGIIHLFLSSLELDLHPSGSIMDTRDVNLGASICSKLVHLTATLTNERRNLTLGNRHRSGMGMVHNPLVQT